MIGRIRELIEFYGLSVRRFALKCGMNQPTLDRMLKGINALNLNCITSILTSFPEVSAEWLLRGNGSMLITEANAKGDELNGMLVDAIATLQQALNEKSQLIALMNDKIKNLENQLKPNN